MDVIFLGEFLGVWAVQGVEICDGILCDLRAGCAAEEEGCFGVFGCFGGFFVEGTFGARVARFAVWIC